MANEELTLLKRYRYDKKESRDKNEKEYTWSALETVDALDVYEYKGRPYVVRSDWYYSGSGDMGGSEHYDSLSFTVWPLAPEDVGSEEAVLRLASGKEGHKTSIGDRPRVDIQSEEAFTKSVHYNVIAAIDTYLADKKKAESEEKLLPNAVYVGKNKAPKSTVIYDFDSQAGIGAVFYNCSSIAVQPLGEESQENLGIDRPLCYCYPADRGSVRVCAYADEKKANRKIIVSLGSKFQTGDGAVICACVQRKPAALTPEEVQKILKFSTN